MRYGHKKSIKFCSYFIIAYFVILLTRCFPLNWFSSFQKLSSFEGLPSFKKLLPLNWTIKILLKVPYFQVLKALVLHLFSTYLCTSMIVQRQALFLKLNPVKIFRSYPMLFHGNTIIYRANQLAQVTAYAFIFFNGIIVIRFAIF